MNQSRITRAMTRDGSARMIFAQTTSIVQRAHEIHQTSKTVTAALGRALTATAMMGCLLKDQGNTLSLQIKGDGPMGRLVCISDYLGNVRGWVENPDAELPPNAMGKLDVGGVVGAGTLTVVRDLGMEEPYIGVSDLVSGEIAEDITEYFAVSEQTPTVCALGVRCNVDFSCKAAGGFLLQLFPGADEGIISVLEQNLAGLDSVSRLIEQGESAQQIIDRVLSGIEYDLFDEIDIDYVCPCSRESYIRGLMSLGADELQSLLDEGEPVEVRCRYCGARHEFSLEELGDMIRALREKSAGEEQA